MNEQIYDLLMKDDEITWQTILLELIKTEQMNPWDVDVTLLCKRYVETIKELKEQNFAVSGKVILAAALLLRIKSTKLLDEDLSGFDQLLFPPEEDNLDDFLEPEESKRVKDIPKLAIKTPQARKRRVTVNDLIGALTKVLDTKRRKVRRRLDEAQYYRPELPEKKIDVSKLIDQIYEKILEIFAREEKVRFSKLVPSDKKEDRVYTFVPLLHLSNQGRISLEQKQAFGDIDVTKFKTPEAQ